MDQRESPSYITLDVDVISKSSLTPLAEYLEDRSIVLGCREVEGNFYLSFEPNYDKNHSPETNAKLILNELSTLPIHLKEIWSNATSRTFNFGFESGTIEPYYFSVISSSILKEIAELNASITITIYHTRNQSNAKENT